MPTILETALTLLQSGVACIPTGEDKRPSLEWKKYMREVPQKWALEKDLQDATHVALVAGKVQCIDFDEKHSRGIFERFCARARDAGQEHLVSQCILQQTPSMGYHLVFQCDAFIRNVKLASKLDHKTMIETRGEGGYFLIDPSPGYKLVHGDWSSIPVITREDRDALLALARTFDETPAVEFAPRVPIQHGTTLGDLTPGDDYDNRADVPSLLKSFNWKPATRDGKYWTRAGKERGVSASWGCVPNRLYVFTSSTAFQPMHAYRPWHIYAILACNGDFSRAASELRRQGFGGKSTRPKPTQPQPADYNLPEDPAGIEHNPFLDSITPDDEPIGVEATPDDPPGIEGIDPSGIAPTAETEEEKIRRMLRARAFDHSVRPPPIKPIFTVNDIVIATPGNIVAIAAQAKVGKSSFVAAMLASTMVEDVVDVDLLGLKGFNPEAKGVLLFDTEQCYSDFWALIDRGCRRAKKESSPDWIKAFSVADFPAMTTRKALSIAMADVAAEFGGLHCVFIDGVADLVLDVNSAEECNAFVAELHMLAIRYNCPIICIIHKNPGSEKTRGHLGSQIERKAETNLNMDKSGDVTFVFSEKQRRAPITKAEGPRFKWDNAAMMHVTTTEGGKDKITMKIIDMAATAREAFHGEEALSHRDLVANIMQARDKNASSARNLINTMLGNSILTMDHLGMYRIPQINEETT